MVTRLMLVFTIGKYLVNIGYAEAVARMGAARCARSARISAAVLSAIMIIGEFGLPEVITGITDASTTRNPATPRTCKLGSTTAIGS